MNINRRIFGSDIPTKIKKKLEARALIAEGVKEPFEEINPSKYPDSRSTGGGPSNKGFYTYQELLANQFAGEADLSSRTPFIRMWTAVELVETPNFDDTDEYIQIGESMEEDTPYETIEKAIKDAEEAKDPNHKFTNYPTVVVIKDPDTKRIYIKRKHRGYYSYGEGWKRIYMLNTNITSTLPPAPNEEINLSYTRDFAREYDPKTHTMSDKFSEKWPNFVNEDNEPIAENNATVPVTNDEATSMVAKQKQLQLFPTEHRIEGDDNQFMKPAAGIISMDSSTEGYMGTIKKTTINFAVHNFADFDQIYNRYFLKPGAQVFIDYGWNSLRSSLYDPADVLKDHKIQHALFDGENSFIGQHLGDVDTLVGLVTDYDSTILPNGTVECSVTVTSKNAALIDSDYNRQILSARISYLLDHLVMFRALWNNSSVRGGSTRDKNYGLYKDQLMPDGTPMYSDYGGVRSKQTNEWGKDDERWTLWNSMPDANSTTDDIYVYQKVIQELIDESSLMQTDMNPKAESIASGVFVYNKGLSRFVSWGLIEDEILNSEFGFSADDKDLQLNETDNFQVTINSSASFTTWHKMIAQMQTISSHDGLPETPPCFLYPMRWGIVPSLNQYIDFKQEAEVEYETSQLYKARYKRFYDAKRQEYVDANNWTSDTKKETENHATTEAMALKDNFTNYNSEIEAAGGELIWLESYNYGAGKYPTDQYPKLMPGTKDDLDVYKYYEYDLESQQIPLREIFVDIEVVKDAFKSSSNTREAINKMLQQINKDSSGIFDWQITAKEGDDSSLAISDNNFLGIQRGYETQEASVFKKLFLFDVMSPNSIVSGYDVSLSMPDGNIGNMYAIQGLSGNNPLVPMNNLLDENLGLEDLFSHTEDDKYINYLPNTTTYRSNKYRQDMNMSPNIRKQYGDYIKKGLTGKLNPTLDTGVDRWAQSVVPDGVVLNEGHKSTMVGFWESGRFFDDGLALSTVYGDGIVSQKLEHFRNELNPASGNSATAKQLKKEAQEARIQRNDEKMHQLGYNLADGFKDYFMRSALVKYLANKRPSIFPMKLTLTTYGISAIQPGDIFRVNYLPKMYRDNIYFQTISVQQKVGPDGWFTTLTTQFRIRPTQKNKSKIVNDDNRKFVITSQYVTGIESAGKLGSGTAEFYTKHKVHATSETNIFTLADLSGYMTEVTPVAPSEPRLLTPPNASLKTAAGAINIASGADIVTVVGKNNRPFHFQNSCMGVRSCGLGLRFKCTGTITADQRVDTQVGYKNLDWQEREKLGVIDSVTANEKSRIVWMPFDYSDVICTNQHIAKNNKDSGKTGTYPKSRMIQTRGFGSPMAWLEAFIEKNQNAYNHDHEALSMKGLNWADGKDKGQEFLFPNKKVCKALMNYNSDAKLDAIGIVSTKKPKKGKIIGASLQYPYIKGIKPEWSKFANDNKNKKYLEGDDYHETFGAGFGTTKGPYVTWDWKPGQPKLNTTTVKKTKLGNIHYSYTLTAPKYGVPEMPNGSTYEANSSWQKPSDQFLSKTKAEGYNSYRNEVYTSWQYNGKSFKAYGSTKKVKDDYNSSTTNQYTYAYGIPPLDEHISEFKSSMQVMGCRLYEDEYYILFINAKDPQYWCVMHEDYVVPADPDGHYVRMSFQSSNVK